MAAASPGLAGMIFVARLNTEVVKILHEPLIIERLHDLGMDVVPTTPDGASFSPPPTSPGSIWSCAGGGCAG